MSSGMLVKQMRRIPSASLRSLRFSQRLCVNALILASLVLLLAGCVTSPPVSQVPGAAAAWLGGTPRVLVRMDATQVTAWKTITQSRESLKPVGVRTKTVWMGFELDHLDDLKTAA